MNANAEAGSHELPLVSIVMPIRDEAAHLEHSLDAIDAQSYPSERIEILIVDGGSTDVTPAIVRDRAARDGRVRMLGGPGVNTPMAMNLGIGAARGSLVAKVDGHGWINSRFIETAVDELTSDASLGCVGGRVVPEAGTVVERAMALARFSVLGVGGGVYTLDERRQLTDTVQCGVYRRDALVDAGAFDPALPYGEDEEANHRLRAAGWGILMNPEMRFSYRVRSSLWSLFKQYFRYGRARVAVVRKHREFLRLKHAVPAILVAVLTASIGLAIVSPAGAAWLVPWAVYLATLVTGACVLAIKHGFNRPDLIVASIAALHVGYGLGTLRGLFDPRRRPSP